MITGVTIKNFKRLQEISFSLAQSVVVIGPNNAGKSTIFQALCLWEIGVTNFIQAWRKKDLNNKNAVSINRKDLMNSPISDARFLWKDRKVTKKRDSGGVDHVKLEVSLKGEDEMGIEWSCNAEFTFSNNESISCRVTNGLSSIAKLYDRGQGPRFGFLQPMSGLATEEDRLSIGAVDRRLGEGRTAEVLRNICYQILYPESIEISAEEGKKRWEDLVIIIKEMFGCTLHIPEYIKSTGIIQLEYSERGTKYDISSGGRGFLQTLLLLAYMYSHPGSTLLLDEPDAHLEVIRQREVFQKINAVANATKSQVIMASHSEVVLDEAAEASTVIALIENNAFELNTSNTRQSKTYIRKALTEIGWEKYYLARANGHILYLEGSTDLQMLQEFAQKINHPCYLLLTKANVQYTALNVPNAAISNFVAIQEFFPELKGLALFDQLDSNSLRNPKLKIISWKKREIENYFANPEALLRHARLLGNKYPLIGVQKMETAMKQAIQNFTIPAYLNDLRNPFWNNEKLSDKWLDLIFPEFYRLISLPQDFFKRDYYQLIKVLKKEEVDIEIKEKLDDIFEVLK